MKVSANSRAPQAAPLPVDLADGVFPAGCHSRTVLDHVTSKWGVLILLALSEGEQDELLRLVESGDVQANWEVAPRQFFQMIVRHVCEGYYSDARNGGNRDLRSWEMVGFEERCGQI